MKELLLLICAVISTAVFVSGSSNTYELTHFSLLAAHFSGDDNLRITEEQIKCMQDGEKVIIESHPNLKEWFDDVGATSKYLTEFFSTCQSLSGFKQKICFVRLNFIKMKEKKRLFGHLNEEQDRFLEQISKLVEECLEVESNLFSSSEEEDEFEESIENDEFFYNGLFDKDNTRIPEEQIKCIQGGYLKVAAEHPALASWFEDIQKTFSKLAGGLQQCRSVENGLPKFQCYIRLYLNFRTEYRRLFGNLTEEQQKASKQLQNVLTECATSYALDLFDVKLARITVDQNELTLFTNNGLFEIFANGFVDEYDARITDEQKQCIQDGFQKVLVENPGFAYWFQDIQKTFTKLAGNVQKCGTLTNPILKAACYVKSYTDIQREFNRLFGNVTEEQLNGLQSLQKVVIVCLLDGRSQVMDFNGNSTRITEEQNALTALKADDSLDVFSKVFANGLLGEDNTRISDEQKKCIQDGYQKVVSENPALASWFEDIQKTFSKLAEDAKRCPTLTDWLDKLRCQVQLYNDFQREYGRLFRNMTQEQKKGFQALQKVITDCLLSGAVTNFGAFNFFDGKSGRITVDEIQCLLEGYKKVIDENEELLDWFDDAQATLMQLTQNVNECESQSGIKQIVCFTKLLATARGELNRLLDKLSEDQKAALQELQDAAKKCFATNSVYYP